MASLLRVDKGSGQIGLDGMLHTDINFRCLGGLDKSVDDVDFQLAYNEAEDTLLDIWGVTWYRTRQNP